MMPFFLEGAAMNTVVSKKETLMLTADHFIMLQNGVKLLLSLIFPNDVGELDRFTKVLTKISLPQET